jgi:hypothetical protein
MALNGLLSFGILFNARSNILRVAKETATGIATVSRSLNDFERQGESRVAKERALEQKRIGQGLLQFAAPLALGAGMARSVAAAATLEEQLDRVQIVGAELGATNQQLANSFIAVSNATGVAARDVAVIAETAGTTGLIAAFGGSKAALQDFVETVAKFSVVSKQTPLVAARQISDLALQTRLFEKGPGAIKRFVSALQVVGKNSASNAKQVAEFTKAMVPLLNTFEESQFTLPQVLAIAGAVRAFGGEVTKSLIKTNVAGIFSIASKNTEEFAKMMGMSTTEFIRFKDTQPFPFFLKMLKILSKLRGKNQLFNEALQSVGLTSKRIAPLIAGATRQIKLMEDLETKAIPAFAGLVDVLEIDFKRAIMGFNQQLKIMRARIKNVQILVGGPMLRAFTGLVKVLNGLLLVIGAIFKSPIGRLGVIVTGVAAIRAAANALAGAFKAAFKALGFGKLLAAFRLKFGVRDFRGFLRALPKLLGIAGKVFLGTMASAVALTFKVVAAVVFLGTVLDRVFGRGLKLFAENFKLVAEGVSSAFNKETFSIEKMQEFRKRGLVPIILALINMIGKSQAFAKGVVKGFSALFESFKENNIDIGSGFEDIVKSVFRLLRHLGIMQTKFDSGTSAAENLGVAVGKALGAIPDLIAFFFDRVFKGVDFLINKFNEFFAQPGFLFLKRFLTTHSFFGAIGAALADPIPKKADSRLFLNRLLFPEDEKDNRPLLPVARLPLSQLEQIERPRAVGPVPAGDAAMSFLKLASFFKQAIAAGRKVREKGVLATVLVDGDVNMDKRKVGRQNMRGVADAKVRAGGRRRAASIPGASKAAGLIR